MVQSDQEVERLVRENEKLVHFQVNRYLQRYFVGAMEREDLVSWGLIGLVQAARHHRPWLWIGLAALLVAAAGARRAQRHLPADGRCRRLARRRAGAGGGGR